ncbi:Dolichyl-phosphate-mannose-protein mannosyltransferase [Candidatus Burarchaeum australiense]|nr:Dolichyl-phosphate-mannose-protein mannosyltransferase [Candidatus Burarchaeum australiense]
MKFTVAFLIALFAFSLIFPLLYAGIPPDRDEGTFLLIAREVKDGSVLYRDYADNKPPGIFFLLIPVVALAGVDTLKIRLAAGLVNYLTAVFIFFIGRKIASEKAGAIGAVSYLILINGFGLAGFLLKTEPISNLFVCAGIYALLQAEKKELHYVLAGALFAVGAMVRQNVAYTLPLAAYRIWETDRHCLKKYVLLGAGVVLGLLPFFAYLVYNGVLTDMSYYTTYGISDPHNLNATGPLDPWSIIKNPLSSIVYFGFFMFLLLSAYGINSRDLKADYKKFLWTWFFLATLVGAIAPFIQSLLFMMAAPPLALLTAVGTLGVWREFKELNEGKIKTFWRYLAFAIVMLFLITSMVTYPDKINEIRQRGSVFSTVMSASDIGYVKGQLGNHDSSGIRFYVVMTEPQLYYMLETKPITKFPFMSSYGYRFGDEKTFDKEVLQKLENAKPDYIVYNDKQEFWNITGISEVLKSPNFEKLLAFIGDNYAEKGRKDEIILYERKDLLAN